ncbi:MAG: response regulator [Desulfonatronovibrio sp.]
MPRIHLLTATKDITDRIKNAAAELLPESEVRVCDISDFPENIQMDDDSHVFVVETKCPQIDRSDYVRIAEGLKALSSEYGLAVLALSSRQGSDIEEDISELEPDGYLDFSFEDQEIAARIEYLIKISELRAMNLNLGAQLGQRVSRLAGLEKKLVHTNWILQALNRCGEVIIKAKNESDMLDDVCEILASSLESALVIVGYAEMDAESSVKIVAARGDKKDMAGKLKFNWDISPLGQGPTGTAIRTGKRAFVTDPVNDSSAAPWKDLFVAHDIRYILSLPIAYAGVGFGALTIYGGKDADFSADDLGHLERVAQNMGYGIWFLRHRHKRKLVEEELQKTNELFTLAMEATEDALWDWDVPAGKAYFSPRWYTMLGYEPNELPMEFSSFLKIVHPEDKERVSNELQSFMEQSVNYNLEFKALTKDGNVRWILARGKVVRRDNEGKPLRIVGTHIDITQRKKMEQELSDARHKAETANKAKDKFLEAMSHELRTPLNGIMSILQTLTKADLESSEKEYIQMALDSSRQLLVSINKILELSSLQKGMRSVYRQPFNLLQEMAKIAGLFMPMARNKNLDLDFAVSENISGSYIGDISIIRQIIWNLVENAIKFTSQGEILLKVSEYEHKNTGQDNGLLSLIFEVNDTGQGISREFQDKLFEPFGIFDDELFNSQEGSGVGLSVCKQLADTIGARIGVESAQGKGSRFYLIVDLEPEDQQEAKEEGGQDKLSEDKVKQIMVVEDEKINMMLIDRMLRTKGFNVLTAADGQEALQVLKQNPDISLILMDIMVPKYDGFELTAMIREGKFSGLKDVPIVAVTALADSESRQKCFAHGMNAYLPKPIDNQDLMGMVNRYVNGS